MRKRKQNDEDQLTFDTMLVSGEAEPESDTYDIFGDIEQLLEKQKHKKNKFFLKTKNYSKAQNSSFSLVVG